MRSTAIDRRELLRLLAGAAAGAAAPSPLRARDRSDARLYLGACVVTGGGYRVGGFSASGAPVLDLPSPARGHSFAVRPDGRAAVLFGRRPGRFALAIDPTRGIGARRFAPPADRHFYGHGVFARDGHLLYASENDFEGARGVIGVYDAADGYARLGEFPSHGVGPHDVRLLADGETFVVANGGILTRPDLPRVKLNLPTMAPSLCYVDRRSGKLLQECRLDPGLHRLSIRHLAVGDDDTVAAAMQYEGPAGDLTPLVALHRAAPAAGGGSRRGPLRLLEAPAGILRAMKRYCGGVCFDPGGRTIAVSAPRGHLVTLWDADGAFLSALPVPDGSGVAPGARPGEILASSGRGGVFVIDVWSNRVKPLRIASFGTRRWDNHLVAAAVPPAGSSAG